MPDPRVGEIQSYLSRIDAATTKSADGLTAIAAKLDNLLNQITGLPTSAEVQGFVDQAKLLVDKVEAHAEALTAMGGNATNPIPVPVPEPEPIPEPIPEPTPVIV